MIFNLVTERAPVSAADVALWSCMYVLWCDVLLSYCPLCSKAAVFDYFCSRLVVDYRVD